MRVTSNIVLSTLCAAVICTGVHANEDDHIVSSFGNVNLSSAQPSFVVNMKTVLKLLPLRRG